MVERCLAKADIAGPNPVSRSMPRYRKIARLFLYTGIRTRGFASTRRASSSRPRCVSVDVRQRGFFYTRGFGPAALQVRGRRPHPAPAACLVDERWRGFFYTRGFGPAALQVRGRYPRNKCRIGAVAVEVGTQPFCLAV